MNSVFSFFWDIFLFVGGMYNCSNDEIEKVASLVNENLHLFLKKYCLNSKE